MQQSHDPFIRGFLSNKQEATDFFIGSLPEKIITLLQLEKLELSKESFIGKELDESRTDLLYKVPLKSGSSAYIYLLFEHKSYYDPKIFTQLLEYLSKIYSWQTENQEELTIVVPFIFYHGEKGWDLGNEFQDSFSMEAIPKDLLRFIPNFPIQLFELKSKGEPFQTTNHALRLYMRMIQIIRDIPEEFKIKLREIYISLRDEKDFAKRIDILRNLLEYLNRARTDAEIYSEKEMVQGIEGEYMNVLDKIREEGKLEGEFKKALETAQKMQKEGFNSEQIIRISGLTESQLKENGIF
jgi:predicted transposase/invertase (TIGR01784 family)